MIELSLYRNRIGCFTNNLKKKGTFKNIHHQKYGRKRRKTFTLEALQAILKLLLIVGFIACGPIHNSTFNLSYHPTYNDPITQPTMNLEPVIVVDSNTEKIAAVAPKAFQLGDNNFLTRYTYGNKIQNGIRIVHWNKGSSFLENKMTEIEPNIQQHRPHIFGLSEANLFSQHGLNNVQLPDYTLHTCPTLSNNQLNVSRVVVYTHNSLVVKPRPDLMNNKISSIWLEVGLPRKRKILVCNTYREWGHLRQEDKSSHSVPEQLERWKVFINQWEAAIREDKEVIVIGDININSLKWMKDDLPSNDSTQKLKALTELLFEKIIPLGVSQLVTVATRSWTTSTPTSRTSSPRLLSMSMVALTTSFFML